MSGEASVTPAEAIALIANGEQGPRTIAVFDFGSAVVGDFSSVIAPAERDDGIVDELCEGAGITFSSISKLIESKRAASRSPGQWAGKTEVEMAALSHQIHEQEIEDSIFPETRQIIAAHRAAGHTIVIAAAASRYEVQSAVAALGIDHLLCTEMEVVEGKLTGAVLGEVLAGPAKAIAVKRFVARHGGALRRSHFYSGCDEDRSLMEAVAFPHPVNPQEALADAARARDWPILRLRSRSAATATNIARNVLGMASILPILHGSLMMGLLGRNKRTSANLIMPTWIGMQLKAAGVSLRVTGAHNLTKRRPAVFLFNHRNNFDASFVASVVKKDYVTIAKAEMAKNPIGKLIALLSHTIFIDRENSDAEQTANTLQQIVDAIEQGFSIIIAPEGTRTRGKPGSLGRFKMGAFHIAMKAKVPVVPVIIRNALDVASRDGPMRPGVVDIAVLPPIEIDETEPRKLAAKARDVRQMFADALGNWPPAV